MFTRHPRAETFLAATASLFAEDEARTNLVEGLARGVRDRAASAADWTPPPALFLGVGSDNDRPTLVVLQTIPRIVAFATGAVPPEDTTLDAAVEALAQHAPAVPKVVGPPALLARFLPRWSARTGADHSLFQRHHLQRLDALAPGVCGPGDLRLAQTADLPLVTRWAQRFFVDVGDASEDAPPPDVRPMVDAGQLVLWEAAHGPVAMAAWLRATATGCAVAYVYTPPEERGRGHATSVVRALTAGLLAGSLGPGSRAFTCLYVDLANPAARRVYAGLGYRTVAESETWQRTDT